MSIKTNLTGNKKFKKKTNKQISYKQRATKKETWAYAVLSLMGCLHDPANVQQMYSKYTC